jgi:hypothetical protein
VTGAETLEYSVTGSFSDLKTNAAKDHVGGARSIAGLT